MTLDMVKQFVKETDQMLNNEILLEEVRKNSVRLSLY